MAPQKTVLITGCSEGGLGDALARAFHNNNFRVLATARNPKKMAHYADLGIETVVLDVQSKDSLNAAVQETSKLTGGSLDVLVNNSGKGYMMPIVDVDLDKVRDLYELNVFSNIAVTQAFLPLLRKAAPGSMVVNNTSIASVVTLPTQGIYCSSKAAAASINDALRLELAPFGIKVVELKTGAVRSRFFENHADASSTGVAKLPANTIYELGRDVLEDTMSGRELTAESVDSGIWAKQVVTDLTKPSPPTAIWRGGSAWLVWILAPFVPQSVADSQFSQRTGFSTFAQRLRNEKKEI